MAIIRVKEFTIDLGEIVKARLDSFVFSRKRIRALRESEFQRMIVDNDLSFQEQLDYRKRQLEEEQGKSYPDNEFIDEIKSSITVLKKLVRQRKYRDKYFTFLQEMASGKKTLEDHLEYLQNELENAFDRDTRDQIQELIIKATEAKREQDRKIIDSQIAFNRKDRTAKSLNEAIDLVKTQLAKPEIQRDNALRTSYQQQLRTLEKEKLEVEIEDKLNWMAVSLVSEDRKNPSLWKLEVFSGFRDKAGTDLPVNIGGVRYNSAKEFWQTTLNNYIQTDFVNEYIKENKTEANVMWNQLGLLPQTYLQNLVSKNQTLKNHPDLRDFQQTISLAIQDSVSNALTLKSKDLTAKYYLDKPDLATEKDYQKAKQELENLKTLFGTDYSLSPEITQLETKLIEKRVKMTEEALRTAKEYAEAEGISVEEALKKYGPTATVEVEAKTFKEKKPTEVAEELIEKEKEKIEKKPEASPVSEEKTEEKVEVPPTTTQQNIHIVKQGETLWSIAQEQLGAGERWKELKTPEGKMFTEEEAKKLRVGQKLIIPSK